MTIIVNTQKRSPIGSVVFEGDAITDLIEALQLAAKHTEGSYNWSEFALLMISEAVTQAFP